MLAFSSVRGRHTDNKFRGGRPFDAPPGNGSPRAVQKYLYVILQRAVHKSAEAHEYFARAHSRIWTSPSAMEKARKKREVSAARLSFSVIMPLTIASFDPFASGSDQEE